MICPLARGRVRGTSQECFFQSWQSLTSLGRLAPQTAPKGVAAWAARAQIGAWLDAKL